MAGECAAGDNVVVSHRETVGSFQPQKVFLADVKAKSDFGKCPRARLQDAHALCDSNMLESPHENDSVFVIITGKAC